MLVLPLEASPTATPFGGVSLPIPTLPPLPMEGLLGGSAVLSPTPDAAEAPDAPEAAEGEPTPVEPDFSVFPNPALGAKVTFRFQSPLLWKFQVGLYDHFGEPVTVLTSEGKNLLDVIWSLDQVPEGLYYYRALAVHPDSQTVHKYPVGKLAVEKDPTPTPTAVKGKKKKRPKAPLGKNPHG